MTYTSSTFQGFVRESYGVSLEEALGQCEYYVPSRSLRNCLLNGSIPGYIGQISGMKHMCSYEIGKISTAADDSMMEHGYYFTKGWKEDISMLLGDVLLFKLDGESHF
ncbi:hypothetical protein L1987_38326 [Smallanthus sonchifolius]|uniref:Uncharacterized protein n=1 Tax=Smallanthus sonchifolius TaxID=185202 RepID=A0ACB9HIB5_9ASTR|nr:hypothetical protein L1987_38326 [Smallanthus sonchifolius]